MPRFRNQRERHGRRYGRRPPRGSRRARLSERTTLGHPFAPDRGSRPCDPRLTRCRSAYHQGSNSRVGTSMGCTNWRALLGFPYRPERHRRIRRRHVAQRFVALLRERQRVVNAGRRQRTWPCVSADGHRYQRLLRSGPPRRQPVLRIDHRSGCRDGSTALAFPGSPPRTLGLRLRHPCKPR